MGLSYAFGGALPLGIWRQLSSNSGRNSLRRQIILPETMNAIISVVQCLWIAALAKRLDNRNN